MSTAEVIEKDVIILGFPSKNEATVTGNSADGFIFTGSASKSKTISGDEVNDTIAKIKEKGLTYSFKSGE